MTVQEIEQKLALAIEHQQAGRLAQAERFCREILAERSDHADALHVLGFLTHQQGQGEQATELIRRAIAIQPGVANYHSNLGVIEQSRGRLEEAAAAYRAALAMKPDFAEIHNNLGTIFMAQEKWDQAIACYQHALLHRAGYAEAHNNLGIALMGKGDVDGAMEAYRAALAHGGRGYVEALCNLGNAFWKKGMLDEALAIHREAVKLDPHNAAAHFNLGNDLKDRGTLDEAVEEYRAALKCNPNAGDIYANLGFVLKDQGLMDEALESIRKAISLDPDCADLASNLLLTMQYDPKSDAATLGAAHRHWNQTVARPLGRLMRPHANERSADRRLRVGYVSPDFRGHPVGRFILPLLAAHDHRGFEIFCYSDVGAEDELTAKLRACADHWRPIAGLSHEEAARRIREDRIDILVDLAAHTLGNRLLVFAQKPAPIQVTYLAYCSSTGLETMDYRLTDRHLEDAASEWYTEKAAIIESYWCYAPSPAAPAGVSELPAIRNGRVTFGSLNNFCKFSPEAVACWAELLGAVPDSRLVLHAKRGSHRERLRNILKERGVEGGRLEFAEAVGLPEYFKKYEGIDIGLDPFPFAGGTTTCDALWMGVPVVTFGGGRRDVGRGGVSILSALGMPELIAASVEAYVEIAAGLAGDLKRLAEMRASLRDRMRGSARWMRAVLRGRWKMRIG